MVAIWSRTANGMSARACREYADDAGDGTIPHSRLSKVLTLPRPSESRWETTSNTAKKKNTSAEKKALGPGAHSPAMRLI
jgi:hypothetical protein